MKQLRTVVLASIVGVSMGVVMAQPVGGKGPGGGQGANRWGSDNTPGWVLMTEQERNEHQERMRAMKSYKECAAYRQQHHEQMVARAKERGGKPMGQPRRDPCSGLKQ